MNEWEEFDYDFTEIPLELIREAEQTEENS